MNFKAIKRIPFAHGSREITTELKFQKALRPQSAIKAFYELYRQITPWAVDYIEAVYDLRDQFSAYILTTAETAGFAWSVKVCQVHYYKPKDREMI